MNTEKDANVLRDAIQAEMAFLPKDQTRPYNLDKFQYAVRREEMYQALRFCLFNLDIISLAGMTLDIYDFYTVSAIKRKVLEDYQKASCMFVVISTEIDKLSGCDNQHDQAKQLHRYLAYSTNESQTRLFDSVIGAVT